MGILNLFKAKQGNNNASANQKAVVDDVSFIKEMQHINGPWQQYDFLLAAMGYGWEYMVDSADYMTKADLDNIGTVSVSFLIGSPEEERVDEYRACGSIKEMNSLKEEAGALGLGGISRIVGAPVKIVWINQTRVLRFFSPVDDEDLMLRYAETVIRRTFGTENAMKKYKPVPNEDER